MHAVRTGQSQCVRLEPEKVDFVIETLKDFSGVLDNWRVWWLMAGQDVQMRYKRSVLGPFWISMSLAVTAAGIGFLNGAIFQQPFAEFLIYLSCGLLVWFYLSAVVSEGCGYLVESESILRNLPVKTPVLAARLIWRNLIIFGHNLVVVFALIVLFKPGGLAPTSWIALPGLFLLVVFGFGVVLFLGALCLRFRDLTQIFINMMQLMFLLTPILWPVVHGRVPPIFVDYNPFYHLVEVVRSPLLGTIPTLANWMVTGGLAAGALALGLISVAVSRRHIYLWL